MLIFKEKNRIKSRTVVIETVLTGESLYYVSIFLAFLGPPVDGLRCHVSKGYQTLDKLKQNQDNPKHAKQCNSRKSACFEFTGKNSTNHKINYIYSTVKSRAVDRSTIQF